MRPGYQRVRCVVCGVPREDALDGFISTRGKCKVCGLEAQLENVAGIEYREGVPYQRWRLGIISRLLPREVVGALFSAGVFEPTSSPILDEKPGRA
jgi:hypothetical protein